MTADVLAPRAKSSVKVPRCWVLDFETEGIEKRPTYPPKPVGFSLIRPGASKSKYYAWGHPCENNCDFETARKALLEVWESGQPILCHNGKFDVDVAETHMKMKPLSWERLHDTLFLLFLEDPHAPSLALKPSSERLLGLPPEERDAVKDWVLANVPEAKKKPSTWGAYICLAPGKLVGTYADGDVTRTKGLFELLYPSIYERGMMPAYDRERRLLRLLLENERQGIRADLEAMETDRVKYVAAIAKADEWLRKRLKAPDLNVDSDAELAKVLDREGIVTEWALTATGKKSTAKANMTPDKFNDPKVASVLGYRGRMSTCVGTFLDSWIGMASIGGGRIYTNWNQVRQSGSSGDAGARTGRMSCNPNFMNIPKTFEDKGDGFVHPKFLKSLPELPLMRKYILPDVGGVFLHRDYSQQELRILGHFEDGKLKDAYNADPRLDVHTFMQEQIREVSGIHLGRGPVKVLNFGVIYGMGLAKLAVGMHSSVDDAKRIKAAQGMAIPGLKALSKEILELAKSGQPICTWGGRQYFPEEPTIMPNGHKQTWEYKLLNYLIQGSAADCTKEALIRYDDAKKHGRFLVTVHDEINLSAPTKAVDSEMKILREVMQSVEFDVPMLSDGKTGDRWGSLTKYKEA